MNMEKYIAKTSIYIIAEIRDDLLSTVTLDRHKFLFCYICIFLWLSSISERNNQSNDIQGNISSNL